MPDTEELISPGRYYLCFCNYATFVVLLIGLTIVAMGVLSYLVVPKRPTPSYVIVNFTDEESEKAPSSPPALRGGTAKPTLAERDICSSRKCDQEADRILGAVNASLDPCDDFYAYVCSAWMKRHEPGEAEDKTSVDYDLLDAYSRFLEGVLSWKNSELPTAKLLYDTCVNPPVGLFKELITTFFYLVGLQRWPYSVSDRVLAADVSSKVGSLHRLLGEDSLFHLTVVERRDGTHPAMSITQPRLLVGRAKDLPLAYFLFLSKAHKALMNHIDKPMHTSVAAVEMDLARRAGPTTASDCADPISKCIVKHLNHLPASRILHWPLLAQEAFGEKMVALNQIVETSNFDYLVSFSDKMPQALRKTDLLNYMAFRVCMVLSPLIGNATLRDHLASICIRSQPALARAPACCPLLSPSPGPFRARAGNAARLRPLRDQAHLEGAPVPRFGASQLHALRFFEPRFQGKVFAGIRPACCSQARRREMGTVDATAFLQQDIPDELLCWFLSRGI
ncbi:hypothetical protein HPB48_013311 [Haemaphysalis longicornis]|uniref:Peptidase M13 N-terminal domain-containing protein n=1 Tax=Haemaphysalis longicornis TaxID=44386 RepID=A0A9J6GPY6_HAELO|nr:hypothetical protein HPB48_013311 [Haemaphysalis longicornis]